MTTPMVDIEGLDLVFPNGTRALEDVSLSIAAGDFVSIVGPSGCGKSTLLRLVAGLIAPSAGRVRLEGKEPRQARNEGTDVAFVFQSPTLLPWRTVEGNVQLPLELRGGSRSDWRIRIAETLAQVGLSDFARAHPHQLSGGMQMRVSLARALVTRPRLLLLDEPFGALDDITRQRLNEELISLWERERITALFVTHNVSEAVFLGHRVLVMSARPGRILREHGVPFVHPRAAGLRAQGEFAALCGEVGDALRMSHA